MYWESMKLRKYKKQPYWHCACTAESANVKVQNIFHRLNNSACSRNCKYRKATTIYTLETWFVSVI